MVKNDNLTAIDGTKKGNEKVRRDVKEQKMIPPDGGWGWVVVFGFALNYFVAIPMIQSFGLIFKDAFRRYNMSARDSTTILNINSALSFGLGLTNGPLLRTFSYRKVAMTGSIFLFIGVTTTCFATTLTHFIITYSIITACGFCLVGASYNLALNSYFRKYRGRATGLGMTATGLGPVVMPQLISYLLHEYGSQGTVLIMGGLVLHSFFAALLLHPVKWHMKPAPPEEDETKHDDADNVKAENIVADVEDIEPLNSNEITLTFKRRPRSNTINSVEHDLDSLSIYGYDTPLVTSNHPNDYNRSLSEVSGKEHRKRYSRHVSQEARTYWWNSAETVNLGSSYTIFEDGPYYSQIEKLPDPPENNNIDVDGNVKKKNVFLRAMTRVAKFFFLDLLKDPIYVNMMIGMSTAIFGEINFSMLTPFILNDFQFTTEEVATVMSIMAGVDIVVRLVVPFIAERFKIRARIMYLFSLSLLICSRTPVYWISIFLGLAKGIRTVYMTLVIPTYVPLEKLPGASGIQMLVNGLIFGALGPILGVIRDYSGSYVSCIYFINGMTLFTIIAWLVEMMITRKGFRGLS